MLINGLALVIGSLKNDTFLLLYSLVDQLMVKNWLLENQPTLKENLKQRLYKVKEKTGQ